MLIASACKGFSSGLPQIYVAERSILLEPQYRFRKADISVLIKLGECIGDLTLMEITTGEKGIYQTDCGLPIHV